MDGKKIVGNGSKATLPNGQNLSDKIQENKTKHNIENNNSRGTKGTSTANNNADNNEKTKSKGQQAAQATGTEAAKQALKTAAGTIPYTKWIPKGIRDKIIDKFMDSGMGQAAVEKGLRQIRTRMIMIIVAVAGSIIMSLLTFIALYAMVAAPVGWIAEALGEVGAWFASLGNWFSGKGWCPTEGECQDLAYKQYYEALDAAVEKYSGNCEINEDLITATIFYGQMVSEEKIESDTNDEDTNDEDTNKNTSDETFYYNYLDVSDAALRQPAKSQINKLIRVFLKGENVDLDSAEVEELEIGERDTCSISAAVYRRYLIDKYIGWAYPSVVNENRTKEEIADEILRMGNISLINRAYSSSIYCPTISVEQEDGTIEPMDLETYVARVVTRENNWYEGNNIENMKAQAIAARTYALNYTNNCKNPIPNSTSAQTLADTPNMMATRAAEETNSLVLLKDGKVFSTQYDALAVASSDDENYYLKQENLAIPKSWLDERVTESQYEYYAQHNHGNGMSQWGSRYLQHIGKNYEEILGTFYTMAEITKMGGLISGGNYSSDSAPAVDVNDLKDRSNTVITTSNREFNLYSSQTGLVSQCSWFARTRAIEIIYYSNMPDDIKDTAINSLMATSANGGEWYDKSDSTIFTKTTDYTQPVPGSIAVWTSSCHRYGHAAIVEQVYEENGETVVLLSETWNKADIHAANTWGNTHYQIKERSLGYMQSHSSGGCTSSFVGYVYLLG